MELDSDFIYSPPANDSPRDLGEKQIAWCRKNIKPFDRAWRQVRASDEHAQKIRERLEQAS